MFHTKNLLMIAALVCVSGLAAAQTTVHPRGGATDVGAKYTPIPPVPPDAGEAVCFGDASPTDTFGTKCPLDNPGRPGHGCNNSDNTGGAALMLSGVPSVVHDTLVLGVRALPTPTVVIYAQATQLRTTPKPFGYGLFCLDGALTQLAVKSSMNSVSKYPEIGEPAASVAGSIKPGQSVYYQVMYKDHMISGLGRINLNLSNAWHTVWAP
jgi:hypothetical protein